LDVALTSVLGILLAVYVIASRGWGHIPPDQLSRALVAVMREDRLLHTAQLAIGFGCSVLGGFVAAWIAKELSLTIVGARAVRSHLCEGTASCNNASA
jgi:hypothetical protein